MIYLDNNATTRNVGQAFLPVTQGQIPSGIEFDTHAERAS
jgi:hypothetical protein